MVKVTARSGKQQHPPVLVSMDYIEHKPARTNFYTKAYDPGEVVKADLKNMLDPILKYIDPVRPLELFALYEIYKAAKIALTELVKLGVPRRAEGRYLVVLLQSKRDLKYFYRGLGPRTLAGGTLTYFRYLLTSSRTSRERLYISYLVQRRAILTTSST